METGTNQTKTRTRRSSRKWSGRKWQQLGLIAVFGLVIWSAVLASMLLLSVPKVYAATITVNTTDDELNNDGDCSLREAIQAANTNAAVDNCLAGTGIDTINLSAVTYALSIAGVDDDNNSGDLDITDHLTIIGNSSTTTIIDGGALDRVFHVITGNVTFDKVTIQNGRVAGTVDDEGGGIYYDFNGGTLNISNSRISSNTANDDGGGVHIQSNNTTLNIANTTFSNNTALRLDGGAFDSEGLTTTVNINSCNFINNSANDDGGAIALGGLADWAALNISSSNFSGNKTIAGAGAGEGGAVAVAADFASTTINSSYFSGNTSASDGGAVDLGGDQSTLTINNSTFSNNIANDDSGAVNEDGTNNTLTISNSTFNNNRAVDRGGASRFYGTNANVSIENSTFDNNVSALGGAIATSVNNAISLTITHTTINGNRATTTGGGIYRALGTVNVKNTIIAANTGGAGPDCAGTITSQGYNLLGNNTGCTFLAATGDLTGTGTSPIDPKLAPLANYGGNTPTRALLSGSPAINQGDPAFTTPPDFDQRGSGFPRVIGGRLDIGAYEITELSISKSGPSSVVTGDPITYTLTVANNGTGSFTSLLVTDTIPAGANLIEPVPDGGQRIGNVISWTIPSLAASGIITVRFVVTAAQTITNSDYGVSSGGVNVTGSVPVVTITGNEVYLPIISKNY